MSEPDTQTTSGLYQALSLRRERREVRLLDLDVGRFDDPICCSLECVPLDIIPEYNALSYVWGNSSDTTVVKVNGVSVAVTKNLETALRHLRSYPDEPVRSVQRAICPLWIDALCINQDDPAERAEQISLMSKIYSAAKNVIVWLGTGTFQTDKAFDLMNSKPFVSELFWWDCARRLSGKRGDLPSDCIEVDMVIGSDLSRRDWWKRLWVRQEFVLAKTSPFVMCGKKGIAWHRFLYILELLPKDSLYSVSNSTAAHDSSFDNLWGITPHALDSVRKSFQSHGVLSLCKVMEELLQNARASDPHDYIYGLLGLVDEEDRQSIAVDYTIDCMSLYKQVARLLWTRNTAHMLSELLHCLRFAGDDNGYPSWVPDFAQTAVQWSQDHLAFRAEETWHKSNGADFSETGRLVLRGISFDRIEAIHKLARQIEAKQGTLELLRNLNSVVMTAQQRSVPQHHLLFRTSKLKQHETPAQTFLKMFVGSTTDDPQCLADQRLWNLFLDHGLTSFGNAAIERFGKDTYLRFLSLLPAKMLNKCLLVTEAGFVGIAVPQIQAGDIVTWVFGTSAPLILRPYSGYYRIVGSAYVSGLMNKGVPDWILDQGILQEEEFEIR